MFKNIPPKKFPWVESSERGRNLPPCLLMWATTCVKSSHKLDASKAEGMILLGLGGREGGGAKALASKGRKPQEQRRLASHQSAAEARAAATLPQPVSPPPVSPRAEVQCHSHGRPD